MTGIQKLNFSKTMLGVSGEGLLSIYIAAKHRLLNDVASDALHLVSTIMMGKEAFLINLQ